VAMVARLTVGKSKYSSVEDQMQATLTRAEGLRAELTADIQRDAAAFEAVMRAFKLPKETPAESERRSQAIEEATLKAAQVPLEVARRSVEVMELARQVVQHGNLNAISDGATGATLARAALTGAGYNVRINAKSLRDPSAATALLAELTDLERRAAEYEAGIQAALSGRGGLAPA
jgi:formiminotetrahydrofolate cyclodeaminase